MPAKTITKAANRSRRQPAKRNVAVPRKAARKSGATNAETKRSGATPSSLTKQSQLITALSTPTGATIAALTALTGWQPHTVRGTISGALRKRLGLQVVRDQTAAGESRYRISAATRG